MLQAGHFDVADRLFASVPAAWEINAGASGSEVKELTPEWYAGPADFLRNTNGYDLGTTQEGRAVDDVVLPPWARGSAEGFLAAQRAALESDEVRLSAPERERGREREREKEKKRKRESQCD